jgi:excisionase family DNA binding protein
MATEGVDPEYDSPMAARFLTIEQVAEELAVTRTQVYTMARKGEIPAIKIGQKGHWRIERARLEEWIAAQYLATAEYVRNNPYAAPAADD